MKRYIFIGLVVSILFVTCIVAVAHSGRTDANGGHWNRSTGEYHYHHGYSAHDHPNGVCPYEQPNTTTKPNTNTSNSNQTTTLDGLKANYSADNDSYVRGYDQGYSVGNSKGHNEGYDEGYNKGIEEATKGKKQFYLIMFILTAVIALVSIVRLIRSFKK